MLISGNEFTNRSRVSAGDRYDVAKNTLTVQWGNYAYVAGNKLRQGPIRVGPLGDGDGWEAPQARFNYAVFEANLFEAPAFVQHGASHVTFRNNVSQAHGYGAYSVEGFDSAYNRGVTNLTFVNNTVNNSSDRGQFLKVEGPVNGINLVNNLYAAPNLTPGAYQAAPVFVAEGSLSSFRTITNNVWSPGRPLAYAEGGANYVWGVWSNPSGYRTESEWNALPQVGTDSFSNTTIDGRYAPSSSSIAASFGRLYGGVFVDYYGKVRPLSGAWSAGAVEV
jgi:hypothetical protein